MKTMVKNLYFSVMVPAVVLVASLGPVSASNDLVAGLDRQYKKVERKSYSSRLGDRKDRRCKACEERERDSRFQYFSRAIGAQHSGEYQEQVRRLILADEKFVKSCWARLSKREIEVFFTINEDGKAEDFAWFPKKTYGKCLSKHVNKIDFPKPEKEHYSWMVASELVVIE